MQVARGKGTLFKDLREAVQHVLVSSVAKLRLQSDGELDHSIVREMNVFFGLLVLTDYFIDVNGAAAVSLSS